jgi:hypothetical protein
MCNLHMAFQVSKYKVMNLKEHRLLVSFLLLLSSFCSFSQPVYHFICILRRQHCRSQWPCGLRRRSAAACLLRSWFQIPPGAWMFVCCECCMLSGRGLCDKLITCPEESYRLWFVVVCDLEASRMRRP